MFMTDSDATTAQTSPRVDWKAVGLYYVLACAISWPSFWWRDMHTASWVAWRVPGFLRMAPIMWGPGIAALVGPQETVDERRELYERRRDRVLAVVGDLAAPCEGTFYVWIRLHEGLTPERLLKKRRLVVAPGEGFGPSGVGWARLSLATPDELLDAGLERLSKALT